MNCSNINHYCNFRLYLNTPSFNSSRIRIPFYFANWQNEQFEYQIIINPQTTILNETNFGNYDSPNFLRPLEFSIFDGGLLNIDSGISTKIIRTNFEDLKDTLMSKTIVILDESFFERLIISEVNKKNDLIYDTESTKLFSNEDISGCAYQNDGYCLICDTGFELISSSNSCNLCLEAYNPFTNKCLPDDKSQNLSSNLINAYIQVLESSSQSEEGAGYCTDSIVDFYPDFLDSCKLVSNLFGSDGFMLYKIILKLNNKIDINNTTIPSTFTSIIKDDSLGTKEYSRQIIKNRNNNNEFWIYLYADYNTTRKVFFVVHLPDYRNNIPENEKPIESLILKEKFISLTNMRLSKSDGEVYSSNDFCPENWYSFIKSLTEIQCFENIPEYLRVISTDIGDHLIPCGSHCLTCSNTSCLECEIGYLKIPDQFDCFTVSSFCFDVIDTPLTCINEPNYYDALVKSVFFFDFQRSGLIPPEERRPCWRYNTFLEDKGEGGEVLVGGWFDSLGTMKLNLQLSFTLLILSQGLIYFKNEFVNAQLETELLQIIRPAIEYLLSSYVNNENVYSHCGDLQADKSSWTRPEDYTGPRLCYKVSPGKHATDLYSSMSSAFSAASIIFRNSDVDFSNLLLSKAESLYKLAIDSPKDSLKTHFPNLFVKYNGSGEVWDELFKAGLMLDKAQNSTTNRDNNIGEYFILNLDNVNGEPWDNRRLNINFLLFESTNDSQYLHVLENYLESFIFSTKTSYFGLPTNSDLSNLQTLTTAIFYALLISKLSGTHSFYEEWVKEMIYFYLGKNLENKSLMINFSSNFIFKGRHKGSSCESPPNVCGPIDETKMTDNPNYVTGGIITGIESNGEINDSRDLVSNEISLINNAPISGILVRLFFCMEIPTILILTYFQILESVPTHLLIILAHLLPILIFLSST